MSSSLARHAHVCAFFLAAMGVAVAAARAADPPDSRSMIADEQRAMSLLAGFDGTWRGPAVMTLPGGRKLSLTQTERVGDMLDRSIKVIEGRGYADDGRLVFNAFGVMSYEPSTGRYHFRSNAQGHGADLPIEISQDRFVWKLETGPVTIRYTATVKDGVWTEVGERLVDGEPPVRVYEMTLTRTGATDWPAAGAMLPR